MLSCSHFSSPILAFLQQLEGEKDGVSKGIDYFKKGRIVVF